MATYETSAAVIHGTQAPTRFAVRQVLDQELQKTKVLRESTARQARLRAGFGNVNGAVDDPAFDVNGKEDNAAANAAGKQVVPMVRVKKDFFGRVIVKAVPVVPAGEEGEAELKRRRKKEEGREDGRVWVSFHEGFSNAVRKPITLAELLGGL